MNRQETLMILGYIKMAFPNAYNKMTKEDYAALAKLWERQFKDFSYEAVQVAVDSYISTDTSGFWPNIAQIKNMIYKLATPDQMSSLEAWNIIKDAVRNSGYFAQEEYDKLPPILQKAVGSPRQLHEWGMMDSDRFNSIEMNVFIKRFEAYQQREKEAALLPSFVKELIATDAFKSIADTTTLKQIGGTDEHNESR